jgi:DNA-binding transcriptional LysR family regulator
VRVRPVGRGDSVHAVQGLVRGGLGVSVLADFVAEADVKSGRLVRVLEHWSLPEGGIHAVYPSTRQVSPKVRAFLDFFRARK